MIKSFFLISFSLVVLSANSNVSSLVKKGERIANVMCTKSKLPHSTDSIESIKKAIISSNACSHLNSSKLEAVSYYILNGISGKKSHYLVVPSDAKCPVCGMFVHKYPKWAAMMKHDGKTYYFDGVKDMMKYYIFDGDFPYNRKHISKMVVSDYYTIEEILAKDAFYVTGSNIYGPMGNELIAFKDKKSAKTFMAEHHGKKIVRFDEITGSMVMALDGIEE